MLFRLERILVFFKALDWLDSVAMLKSRSGTTASALLVRSYNPFRALCMLPGFAMPYLELTLVSCVVVAGRLILVVSEYSLGKSMDY